MQIEIKNVKHSQFASEETHCFKASLYVEGKKVALVGNDGHGGCDYVYPEGEGETQIDNCDLLDKMYDYIKTLPEHETSIKNEDGTPWMCGETLETIVGELVNVFLAERDCKRKLKTRIMFVKKATGALYQYGAKFKPTAANIEEAKSENPEYTILNSLAFPEALKLYRASAS